MPFYIVFYTCRSCLKGTSCLTSSERTVLLCLVGLGLHHSYPEQEAYRTKDRQRLQEPEQRSAVLKKRKIPHVEADTMFRYSFKILPDRLKLIRLYSCGSLGQSISFVFGARVGHFAATPQSDVVGIRSRDLGVMATLSVRQKMTFFRAFITLRSQFHLHHRSQRTLTEIVSKITPNPGLVL